MICDGFPIKLDRGLRFGESNELSRDHPSLVHQLIEAVLTVGAWFSEDDRASINTFGIPGPINSNSLAIAFHVNLLDVGGKSVKGLAVRKDCPGGMTANVSVVEA